MNFAAFKKTAALIVALALISQPLCAARAEALALPGPLSRVAAFQNLDWLEIAAHLSAFTGISYWLCEGVREIYHGAKKLALFNILDFLLRRLPAPEWRLLPSPRPPDAYSI